MKCKKGLVFLLILKDNPFKFNQFISTSISPRPKISMNLVA